METVFEEYVGDGVYNKIDLIDGKYQCFETPLFGGDYMIVGEPFETLDEAKQYLKTLF